MLEDALLSLGTNEETHGATQVYLENVFYENYCKWIILILLFFGLTLAISLHVFMGSKYQWKLGVWIHHYTSYICGLAA